MVHISLLFGSAILFFTAICSILVQCALSGVVSVIEWRQPEGAPANLPSAVTGASRVILPFIWFQWRKKIDIPSVCIVAFDWRKLDLGSKNSLLVYCTVCPSHWQNMYKNTKRQLDEDKSYIQSLQQSRSGAAMISNAASYLIGSVRRGFDKGMLSRP